MAYAGAAENEFGLSRPAAADKSVMVLLIVARTKGKSKTPYVALKWVQKPLKVGKNGMIQFVFPNTGCTAGRPGKAAGTL